MFGDATLVHPQAQALVSDELDDANDLIKGGALPPGAIDFVLIHQYDALLCLSNLFNDLFEPITHHSNKHLGAPDEMVHDKVGCTLLVNHRLTA